MDYEPYLDKGLTSFEDVINTFTRFNKGGFWVKKIVNKGGFFREIVEGPYKKQEADKISYDWSIYFKYKDYITAKVYTFDELCCNFTIDEKKKEFFYEEHIWQPPKGVELFCLINDPQKILVVNKKESKDINFQKFYTYARNNNINSILVYDYLIIFNEVNYKSIIGSKIAKKLIIDYTDRTVELNYLLNYLMNDEDINDFVSIPQYLREYKKNCYLIYLSYFRELSEIEKFSVRLNKFYNKLKNCLPRENFKLVDNDIEFNFYLILTNRDYQAKIFKLMKKEEDYILSIGNDEYFIRMIISKDLQARLEINLNKDFKEFNEMYAQGDKKFQKINNLLALIFYLAKCLGVKKILYKADQLTECICDSQGVMLYEEIINLLANQKSIYQQLGFFNSDNKKVIEKIKSFQYIKVKDFLTKKIEDQEEVDPFMEKNLREVAQLYLKGICNYEYGCYLMEKINLRVYEEIKNMLNYILNLNNKDLKFFRKMF